MSLCSHDTLTCCGVEFFRHKLFKHFDDYHTYDQFYSVNPHQEFLRFPITVYDYTRICRQTEPYYDVQSSSSDEKQDNDKTFGTKGSETEKNNNIDLPQVMREMISSQSATRQ